MILEIVEYLIYFIKNYFEFQSNIQCDRSRSDTSPVSMAEIWPNPIGVEKYDVTLFNGFNLPVKITPSVITLNKITPPVMDSLKILGLS